MNLRIANINDFDLVYSMALKFAKAVEEDLDENKARLLVKTFLSAPNEEKIIILFGEQGMLAAMAQPHMLGNYYLATEVAWWVEPDERGKKVGKELKDAYEFWAKKIGAKKASLTCYDERTSKFVESEGYRLYERSHLKDL